MVTSSGELRITRNLEFDTIVWPTILSILTSRFQIDFSEASKAVNQFCERFNKPLNLYWFLKSSLNESERKVVAAICEANGADVLIVNLERKSRTILGLTYSQEIRMAPNLKGKAGSPGTIKPLIRLSLFGVQVPLRSALSVLLMQLIIGSLAVVGFAMVAGCFLYGLSVLILFFWEPAVTTVAATRRAGIGFALLAMLVGCSAVFGRAIYNLGSLVRHRSPGSKT